MQQKRNLIGFALVAILVFEIPTASQNFYQITNLGVLPGGNCSLPRAINSSGVVVGDAGTCDSDGFFQTTHAFVYKNCQMSDLGTLGGNQSSAQAISRQGTIVGYSFLADGTKRAFSYSQGAISDLGGDPSLLESAFAISGWQLPVGIESATGGLGAQGVWYFNGRTFKLPSYLLVPPSGTANVQQVTGVNDLLQVTAFLSNGQGEFGGFVGLVGAPGFGPWTPIQGIPGQPQGIPGADVFPRAINVNGHIAGEQVFDSIYLRAFFSTNPNSPAVDLGTIGNQRTVSGANAINNNDLVVGYSEYQADPGLHAFLYNGSAMVDLNSRLINGAGWNLVEATGINDNGQIVGWGSYSGQVKIGFLLNPRRSAAGPVLPCQSRLLLP
jgi:probable HAF family extracellular repeat protein